MIYKTLHRKPKIEQHKPREKPGMNACSTNGTRRVTVVTNPVISHTWGMDGILITANATYPWSFMIQIFSIGDKAMKKIITMIIYKLKLLTLIYSTIVYNVITVI
jgi:hypothetical protein